MKKYLITGASGSIGINMVSHILEKTDGEVIVLDSFRHKGYRDRLTRIKKDNPQWVTRIREYQQDLVCPISPELIKQIGHVDYIIHLAALSDVFFSVENPVYTIQNNVNSTLTMLEYARVVKPEQFIYFSTDEVMGAVKKGTEHKEWETHRPSNAYAASKAASEDICYAYWRSYDVPVIITNTMNNFGFMQSGSKFPVMVQKALEDNKEVTIHGNENEIGTRFYIDSRIASEAILHIISLGAYHHKVGEVDELNRYNVVGERAYSNLELAEIIAKLMGKELKYKLQDFHKDNPAHDIHYGLSGEKLAKTGFKPSKNLEECLREVIEWQSKNPEWIQ
jgi:dTDP-glucose 4,6-dehydratase